MDYYYYDQLEDNQLEGNDDYDYDSMILSSEESFVDVYHRCIKSSTQQVQQYIIVLLGCGFLQRVSWELLRRVLGEKYHYFYHVMSLLCGLISLWFYVGAMNSIYVCLHVLNLCLFLKLVTMLKSKYTGLLLCFYTIICQLYFEYLLKSEQYEAIRGSQMVVGMKLISLAFSIQDEKETYQCLTFLGYLLSPASLILGPWIPLKDYRPVINARFKLMDYVCKILLNIVFAIAFLNLSNCILPWIKEFLGADVWWGTYLDAFSVRCSHYFVCFLSQATLISATGNSWTYSSLYPTQSIVDPWAIEFPRSLSAVIRNWNIPMHLWLKLNIFDRLRSTKYPYFMSVFITYLVSCLVHGFNFRVHLVLISLSCFSYFENLLRRCLAQIFDSCIESSPCNQNCKYSNCPRRHGQSFSTALLLVRFVNFLFSVIVVIQLAYLGVMLNMPTTSTASENITQICSNMNYMGHVVAVIMLVFYKCI